MGITNVVREAKHMIYLRHKEAMRRIWPWRVKIYDRWRTVASSRRPFTYHEGHYPHTFLLRPTPEYHVALPVPRRIFVIWVGRTAMNARRQLSFESIQQAHTGLDVIWVDESSWSDWILDDAPVHPAFNLLSPVHQSDYMRAYLMHFHGGGYCDIKPISTNWEPFFQKFDDANLWAMGYPEITSEYTPDLPRGLGQDLKRHFRSVFGTSAFIFRPRTPFTEEWWRELTSRMNYFATALAESPGTDPYNVDASYPIRWTEILGDITQPLCLKHHEQLKFSSVIRPQLRDYR